MKHEQLGGKEMMHPYRLQQLQNRLIHATLLEVDLRLLTDDLDHLVIDVTLYPGQCCLSQFLKAGFKEIWAVARRLIVQVE